MPGRNDIDMRAGVSGVEKSKRDLRSLEGSTRKVGKTTKKSQDEAAASTKKHEGALTKLTASMKGFVLGFFGVTAAIGLISRSIRKELSNLGKAADEAGQRFASVRELLSLGDFAKQHPDVFKEIEALQQQARLPGVSGVAEVAAAYTSIVSKTPNLADTKRMGILREAAQSKRLAPGSSLQTITDLMVFLSKTAPEKTPNQLQNIVLQGLTEAGATLQQTAGQLPNLLGIGQAAGLSVEDTFALFATATSVFPEPSRATTGLRMMLSRLQGKNLTPEGEAIKRGLGLQPGQGVFEQLGTLNTAFNQGQLGISQLQQLFGEEAGPLASVLIPQLSSVLSARQRIGAVGVGARDLTADKLGDVFVPGSVMALEENVRLAETKRDEIQNRLDARRGLELKLSRTQYYTELRELGYPDFLATFESYAQTLSNYFTGGGTVFNADEANEIPSGPVNINNGPVIIHNQRDGQDDNARLPQAAP